MNLNPYGQDPVEFVIDLTNHPPASATELTNRCVAAGMALEGPADDCDLTEVLDFLARWVAVVDAQTPQQRAELVNSLLTDFCAHPRLTDHANGGWHIHYRDDSLRLSGVFCAVASVGTLLHLAGRGMHRLGRCALAECSNTYADFSRAGRQRYCSHGCANRDAVRRHRARQGPLSK